MSTKAKPTTSVQAEIHITIQGQLHKLSKADAIKLRDAITESIGDNKQIPVYISRDYNPPPYRPHQPDRWDKITCGGATGDVAQWRQARLLSAQ